MLKKVVILCTLLITVLTAGENGAALSQKGSKWYGLGMNFTSAKGVGDDYSLNSFTLNSITRFYPANNFILGPSFEFSRISAGESGDRERINFYDLGFEIGCSGNIKEKVLPYFLLRPIISLWSERYDGDTYVEPSFKAEAKLGCLVFVNDYIGFQIEPNYLFQPLMEQGSFGIDFGFTFMLDKRVFSLCSSSRSVVNDLWWWW